MSRKTVEQERAYYCRLCVERLRLVKDGKWFDLDNKENRNLLPAEFDEFYKFRFYDGVRKELYKDFISWLNKKGEKDEIKSYEKYRSEIDFKELDYLPDYSSHAKRLPQMIISNGLIPTLAFYKSKGKDRGQIYGDIDEIMSIMFEPYKGWKNNKEGYLLLEYLLESDFNTLRLATVEALAIAEWLKRIVEVEIEEEE